MLWNKIHGAGGLVGAGGGGGLSVVGTEATYLTGTTNATLTLPTGTLSTDLVLLNIVYENSTTNRPSISGFSILQSRNGVFVGSSMTHVLMSGTHSGSTLSIPNDATFNGCVVGCMVLRNAAVSASQLDAANDDTISFNRTLSATQAFVVIGCYDGGSAINNNWSPDTDWDVTGNWGYITTGWPANWCCITHAAAGPKAATTYTPGGMPDISPGFQYGIVDLIEA